MLSLKWQYVIVITPLPGHYRVYTRNDIHKPEGLMNIIECVLIMHVGRGVITDLYKWKP